MVYKGILLLILLANVIALPIAYIGIHRRLQSYAFHVDINA